MQWLDTEQSDFDKRYVEGASCDVRERWFCMVEGGKRGKKEGGAEGNSQSPRDERM
jgi:hypothetical protein